MSNSEHGIAQTVIKCIFYHIDSKLSRGKHLIYPCSFLWIFDLSCKMVNKLYRPSALYEGNFGQVPQIPQPPPNHPQHPNTPCMAFQAVC